VLDLRDKNALASPLELFVYSTMQMAYILDLGHRSFQPQTGTLMMTDLGLHWVYRLPRNTFCIFYHFHMDRGHFWLFSYLLVFLLFNVWMLDAERTGSGSPT
jgi:hypothetical protein